MNLLTVGANVADSARALYAVTHPFVEGTNVLLASSAGTWETYGGS